MNGRSFERTGAGLQLLCGLLLLASLEAQPAAADPSPKPEVKLILRERTLGVMGTDLQVRVLGEDPDGLDRAIQAAIDELRRVEDVMTDWRESPLMQLNAAAGEGPRKTLPELQAIIARALEVSRLTEGAFDISYAAVGKLWDFKQSPPKLPEAAEIERALAKVGWQRIHSEANPPSVDLPAQMKIGLGAIAKGYGVDRAMDVLLAHGVRHGIINAGGDMKILGRKFGAPWEVAIKHPRDRERAIAVLRISNVSLVTSGDYERYFEIDGRRYHHIIDPRTGYPAEAALSATVIHPSAEFADALATALSVLGPERGLALIEGLERTEAIIVDIEGGVHASSGLKSSLRPGP